MKNSIGSSREGEREHENCSRDEVEFNDVKEGNEITREEVKVNDVTNDTKIKDSKIYHYSSSSLKRKEMFFPNPLFPLYKKGAVSLTILIFTIIALILRNSIPANIGIPFIGGLSIFLIAFIDELKEREYVRSGI